MSIFSLKHKILCITSKFLNTNPYFLTRQSDKATGFWICIDFIDVIRGGDLESGNNLSRTEDPSSD